MADAAGILAKLRDAYKNKDMSAGKTLLAQIKMAMMSFKSMPGTKVASESDVSELLIAREAYELGCLISIGLEEIEGFERHFALVKSCYTDYAAVLPESENQQQLQGLNLLGLLAQSKIAEFHTELELIPVDLRENQYIKFPIKLEQYLMEGTYRKVEEAQKEVPAPSYSYFVSKLSGTVRDSIADSSEAAYESLPLADALKMLSMKSADELSDYAAMREREWEVDTKNNVVRFRATNTADLSVPSKKLIIETLSYAKELERIV